MLRMGYSQILALHRFFRTALTIALLVGSLMAGCDSTERVYSHKGQGG